MLRGVGRFEEASDLVQLSYARDPYVPTKIGWTLRSLEFDGKHAQAEALNLQGSRWWPEFKRFFFDNRLLALLERGDWESIRRLEQATPPGDRGSDYTDSTALVAAIKAKSADAVRKVCPRGDDYWLNVRCLIAFASVGDMNSAYALVDKLYPNRVGRTPTETERIWPDNPAPDGELEFITSPAASPLRRDPRYLALAERTGLLAYWRGGRAPISAGARPSLSAPI